MKHLVWVLVGLLIVLHQDFWQARNDTLVLGWIPYSLAYHGALSLAAAGVWLLAVRTCWPADGESAESSSSPGGSDSSPSRMESGDASNGRAAGGNA